MKKYFITLICLFFGIFLSLKADNINSNTPYDIIIENKNNSKNIKNNLIDNLDILSLTNLEDMEYEKPNLDNEITLSVQYLF